jgi:hemin uptake protein HemP
MPIGLIRREGVIVRWAGAGFDNTNENGYHSFTMRLEEDKPAFNQGSKPGTRTSARRVPSRELLGESGELVIEHNGREYRLRLTQSGKLILTA